MRTLAVFAVLCSLTAAGLAVLFAWQSLWVAAAVWAFIPVCVVIGSRSTAER